MKKQFLSIALLVGSLQVPTINAALKSKPSGAEPRQQFYGHGSTEPSWGELGEEEAGLNTAQGDIEQRPMVNRELAEEIAASRLRGAEYGGAMHNRPTSNAVRRYRPGEMTDEQLERMVIGKSGINLDNFRKFGGQAIFTEPRLPLGKIYQLSDWDRMLVKAVTNKEDLTLLKEFAKVEITKDLVQQILDKVNDRSKTKATFENTHLSEQETEFMYAVRHLHWVSQEFEPKKISREPRELRGPVRSPSFHYGMGPKPKRTQTTAEIKAEEAAYKKNLLTRRDEGPRVERDRPTAKKAKIDDSKTK